MAAETVADLRQSLTTSQRRRKSRPVEIPERAADKARARKREPTPRFADPSQEGTIQKDPL